MITEQTTSEPTGEAALPPLDPCLSSPTFAALGVREETVAALAGIGITHTFAIQEYALPIALRGSDLIGQAPTGTGKTLGFGVPLLQRVLSPADGSDGRPQALVVLPTRELGLQVARDLAAAGRTRGVRVLPVYGGVAYEPQVEALDQGIEIVVGTPGRLLDLANNRKLRLDAVQALVLDEADRMLDLGFLDDVERILAMLPDRRQTMLFSATMPDPIAALARRFLRQPITVRAYHDSSTGASPLTTQVVYRAHPLNKVEVLARVLQARERGLTMIFTRTKRAADRVAEDLDFRGFAAAAVHGDLGQGARERALRAFRVGKIDVLVATDVAARGLDVLGVTHVINYDCPEDADAYVHRVGRTGRAGATGVAVTFVDWDDTPRWRLIEKALGLDLTDPSGEPRETYHTSPHLYEDLDIPAEASGVLPAAQRTRIGLSAEQLEDVEGKRGRGRAKGRRGRSGHSGRAGGGTPTRGAGSTRGTGEAHRIGGHGTSGGAGRTVDPSESGETAERGTGRRRRRRQLKLEVERGAPAAVPQDLAGGGAVPPAGADLAGGGAEPPAGADLAGGPAAPAAGQPGPAGAAVPAGRRRRRGRRTPNPGAAARGAETSE